MSASTYYALHIAILTLWTVIIIGMGIGVAYVLNQARLALNQIQAILKTTRRTTENVSEPVTTVANAVNSVAEGVQAVAEEVKDVFSGHSPAPSR